MGKFFDQSNPFWKFVNKTTDIIFMNMLFLLCCLPVVTIGPAYTALYYTLMKSVRRERGYAAKNFFHSFLQNIKQGLISWIIILAISFGGIYGVVSLWGRTEEAEQGLLTFWISVFVLLFMIIMTMYLFPVLSRFNFTLGQLFSFSLVIAFKYLLTTIALLLMLAATVALCYLSTPLFVFIMPALFVFGSSFLIERIFKIYMPQMMNNDPENQPPDPWYLE